MCTHEGCRCNLFRASPPIELLSEIIGYANLVKEAIHLDREASNAVLEEAAASSPLGQVCSDCPIGGRDGNGPICPNVDKCDRECMEQVEAHVAEIKALERIQAERDERMPFVTISESHIPGEFIRALNRVFEDGVRGDRVAGGWRDISADDARSKLNNLRVHLAAGEYDSVASNALILWWHFQDSREETT